MTENLTKQLNSCKIAHAPSLSGMPLDIINRILDKLDPIFRFSLRRVCRNLRNVIDNRDPEIEQVHVLFQSNQSVLTINSTFEFDYNLYAILDDLASLWKNPKLQLKSFYASTSGKHQETVVDSFEEIARLDYQIHCKHFGLYLFEFDDVLTFLPLFKPGILEEIVITTFEQVGNDEAFDIIETEQWKQAKSITLHSMNKNPKNDRQPAESVGILQNMYSPRRVQIEEKYSFGFTPGVFISVDEEFGTSVGFIGYHSLPQS